MNSLMFFLEETDLREVRYLYTVQNMYVFICLTQ
jgi:hypothetical protein